MYVYIWEYFALAEYKNKFEEAYNTDGGWVELFRQGAGYLRTYLLQDKTNHTRYVTIDYWESIGHQTAFKRDHIDD
ncbi:MAG: antibiotic biosynthesis monooxygenase [Candidatus Heimdallarchaeota archaeon]|nr:antibiotic biosynthesis monooxygenase [Candidatus Heimdallarchaeota archaeon]